MPSAILIAMRRGAHEAQPRLWGTLHAIFVSDYGQLPVVLIHTQSPHGGRHRLTQGQPGMWGNMSKATSGQAPARSAACRPRPGIWVRFSTMSRIQARVEVMTR